MNNFLARNLHELTTNLASSVVPHLSPLDAAKITLFEQAECSLGVKSHERCIVRTKSKPAGQCIGGG